MHTYNDSLIHNRPGNTSMYRSVGGLPLGSNRPHSLMLMKKKSSSMEKQVISFLINYLVSIKHLITQMNDMNTHQTNYNLVQHTIFKSTERGKFVKSTPGAKEKTSSQWVSTKMHSNEYEKMRWNQMNMMIVNNKLEHSIYHTGVKYLESAKVILDF